MTDPDVHAIVAHMGTHQKRSLMKFARGEKVNAQTIGSFLSRGLVREDEYGSMLITAMGAMALSVISEEAL